MTHVVLDGPMGTELARRGVSLPGPAWSAEAIVSAPATIAAIHRAYVAAGATVHTANTFRTRRRVLGSRWEELARRAVRIARASVPRDQRVAGSIGPVQDCYRPDLSPGVDSRLEHRELAQVLADEGVDVLLCESFPSAVEAAVAVEEAARTGVATWAALTAGPDATLMTPEAMGRAAQACLRAGACVLLVNCTPATKTLAFIERIAEVGAPFGAYANAGREDEGIGWGAEAHAGSRVYASIAGSWARAGATLIGGCCGTGPQHVAEVARVLQRTSFTSTRP